MFSRKMLSRSLTAILTCSLFGGVGLIHASAIAAPAAQMANSSQSSNTTANKHHKRMSDSGMASPSEIANAKAKGLVWVNTQSKTYHTGGRYYGKTRHGKFMTEADARHAGYKAAKH